MNADQKLPKPLRDATMLEIKKNLIHFKKDIIILRFYKQVFLFLD